MNHFCKKHAVIVDAGYLFAQSAELLFGRDRPRRDGLNFNEAACVEAIYMKAAQAFPDSELLRIYWYDAPPRSETRMSSSQQRLAQIDCVKLRLGSLNSEGQQKGVDALICRDIEDLARKRAVDGILVLGGDEDLRLSVQEAQSHGLFVKLLAVGPGQASVSFQLQMESDGLLRLLEEDARTYLSRKDEGAADEPRRHEENSRRDAERQAHKDKPKAHEHKAHDGASAGRHGAGHHNGQHNGHSQGHGSKPNAKERKRLEQKDRKERFKKDRQNRHRHGRSESPQETSFMPTPAPAQTLPAEPTQDFFDPGFEAAIARAALHDATLRTEAPAQSPEPTPTPVQADAFASAEPRQSQEPAAVPTETTPKRKPSGSSRRPKPATKPALSESSTSVSASATAPTSSSEAQKALEPAAPAHATATPPPAAAEPARRPARKAPAKKPVESAPAVDSGSAAPTPAKPKRPSRAKPKPAAEGPASV